MEKPVKGSKEGRLFTALSHIISIWTEAEAESKRVEAAPRRHLWGWANEWWCLRWETGDEAAVLLTWLCSHSDTLTKDWEHRALTRGKMGWLLKYYIWFTWGPLGGIGSIYLWSRCCGHLDLEIMIMWRNWRNSGRWRVRKLYKRIVVTIMMRNPPWDQTQYQHSPLCHALRNLNAKHPFCWNSDLKHFIRWLPRTWLTIRHLQP